MVLLVKEKLGAFLYSSVESFHDQTCFSVELHEFAEFKLPNLFSPGVWPVLKYAHSDIEKAKLEIK